jgi:excisionase family DNA binding protein
MAAPEDERLIIFAEARARLGVHGATLQRWIAEGRLAAHQREDGRRVLRLTDVERLRRHLADPR